MEWLEQHLGAEAERYFNLARGLDDRPVVPDREAKSIGHEQTFEVDVAEPDEIRRVLLDQVEQVGRRLRQHGLHARGLSIKIRYGDFRTITRSRTFGNPTDSTTDFWQVARGLFDGWSFQPVRLIGATAERLTRTKGQMPLFADPANEGHRELDHVIDRINDKYGERTIRRGGSR
jgi:DNA polymerase-4